MTKSADMRKTWNAISPHYQTEHKIPTDFVHYGPHCPNEDELQLVGDVKGKHLLEIGCGGGQCSVAFAKQGAIATGLDISDEQVKFARKLAKENGVEATFRQGDVTSLKGIAGRSQDVVFSAYALQYLKRLDRCFSEVARVLRPGGLFVFSLDHPFWYCLAEKELQIKFSYFDSEYSYEWEQSGLKSRPRVWQYQRTVGEYYRLLTNAGLAVLDIVEPEPVEAGSGQDWGAYYSPERQRMVPATVIWKARKPCR
jgi:ubiquinone/menaquinone biosynthesis C-methylase UbiE